MCRNEKQNITLPLVVRDQKNRKEFYILFKNNKKQNIYKKNININKNDVF